MLLLPQACRNKFGLGCSDFARHYSRNHFCFLFLRVLRCFSSPGLPSALSGMSGLLPDGLPHSDILGSRLICSSPKLFAAYHVFLRLHEPRHPPFALVCFFSFFSMARVRFLLLLCSMSMIFFSFVENNGFEPLTLCVQSRCSSQLS